MNEEIESLLTSYQIAVAEIRQALRQAGLSEREVLQKTITIPNFNDLLPEDVLYLYKEIKVLVILYLRRSLKLSIREIVKRLGGASSATVHKILGVYSSPEQVNRATLDEVMEDI